MADKHFHIAYDPRRRSIQVLKKSPLNSYIHIKHWDQFNHQETSVFVLQPQPTASQLTHWEAFLRCGDFFTLDFAVPAFPLFSLSLSAPLSLMHPPIHTYTPFPSNANTTMHLLLPISCHWKIFCITILVMEKKKSINSYNENFIYFHVCVGGKQKKPPPCGQIKKYSPTTNDYPNIQSTGSSWISH